LSAHLHTERILGLDFLINCEAEISFPEKRITLRVNEEVFYFEFTRTQETSANHFCDLGLMSIHPQTQHLSAAVKKGQCYTKNFTMGGYRRVNSGSEKGTGPCMEDSECLLDDDKENECLLNDDNGALMWQSAENAVATTHERGWKFCQESLAAYLDCKDN